MDVLDLSLNTIQWPLLFCSIISVITIDCMIISIMFYYLNSHCYFSLYQPLVKSLVLV